MNDAFRTQRAHQLAHLLLSLKREVQTAGNLDEEASQALQNDAAMQFAKEFTAQGLKLPSVDLHSIVMPELGPRNGESELKLINRCWNILKYLNHVTQNPAI